ncbi:DNA repair endonuclease [Spatholobus suberectus]|nr:DNA repair endonuclease [Spatholobus suberectus]
MHEVRHQIVQFSVLAKRVACGTRAFAEVLWRGTTGAARGHNFLVISFSFLFGFVVVGTMCGGDYNGDESSNSGDGGSDSNGGDNGGNNSNGGNDGNGGGSDGGSGSANGDGDNNGGDNGSDGDDASCGFK